MDPIKEYFESRPAEGSDTACPSEEKLLEWAENRINDADREKFIEHAASCGACTQKAALIKSFQRGAAPTESAPRALDAKVAAALRGKRGQEAPRTGIWFALFCVFMGLSFVWGEYFLQMLVLAVVFAGKWLIESRARRIFIDVTHRGSTDADRGGSAPGARGRLRSRDEADRP